MVKRCLLLICLSALCVARAAAQPHDDAAGLAEAGAAALRKGDLALVRQLSERLIALPTAPSRLRATGYDHLGRVAEASKDLSGARHSYLESLSWWPRSAVKDRLSKLDPSFDADGYLPCTAPRPLDELRACLVANLFGDEPPADPEAIRFEDLGSTVPRVRIVRSGSPQGTWIYLVRQDASSGWRVGHELAYEPGHGRCDGTFKLSRLGEVSGAPHSMIRVDYRYELGCMRTEGDHENEEALVEDRVSFCGVERIEGRPACAAPIVVSGHYTSEPTDDEAKPRVTRASFRAELTLDPAGVGHVRVLRRRGKLQKFGAVLPPATLRIW